MRFIFLFLLISANSNAFGQKQTLKNLEADICTCMSGHASLVMGSEEYNNCIYKNLEKYRELTRELAKKKYGDSAKHKAMEFMRSLQGQICEGLVNNCPTFFEAMDKCRAAAFQLKNKEELLKELKMRKAMDRRLSGNYFWYRSQVYIRLGEYKRALTDADSSIKDKPKDDRGYAIKGWIKECTGNYHEAIRLYEKAYALAPLMEHKMAIAMARKKLKQAVGK